MRTGQNIYKRKDGRWEGRYWKGRSDSGKIIYGFCYGRTYSETKEKLTRASRTVKEKNAHSENVQPQHRLISFYCDEWLQENKLRLKESTYVKYEAIIRKYIRPYFGSHSPETLTSEMISTFGVNLMTERALASKTVKDILLVLHSVLEHVDKKVPGTTSAVKIVYPKESRKQIRVLSLEEQAQLTEYLLEDMDSCKFGVLLALWTGMRIGEVCALQWNCLSISDNYIFVNRTMQRLKNLDAAAEEKTRIVIDTPKSDSSIRIVPLTQRAAALCERMRPQNPAAYILTGHEKYMEPRVLQYHFQRYVDACGIENCHFHTLRHTFATRCIEAGFEIKSLSEILGHANTSITLNRYVHCSLQLKRENMKKLESVGM